MKLGSQPVNAHGPTAFASGIPTVLPTNPNSPFAKLIVKSDAGQIVQQWLLLHNKCTLGSASSCALRCQLPGIAPYHALLVMGARQIFIRALAPKLARNGVIVNELLLTEDQSNFEIAGHQFELIRNAKTTEPTSSSSSTPNKLKFTLARPMEIGQVRQPTVSSAHAAARTPTSARTPAPTQAFELPQSFERSPKRSDASELQPQWITDLIQSAMLPLERQLNEIIEPLAAVQNELDKRSKQERKRRSRSAKRAAPDHEASSEHNMVARSAVDRIAPDTTFTTQIDVQPQIAHIPETVMIPILSPEVESQLVRQSETLDKLNARLTEVKSNLGSLERIVSENFVTVIGAASAPTLTPEPVHEALQQIASVAEQLQDLTSQMDHVKNNLGSLQHTVSENLASTKELRNAPEPASREALEQLTAVANQLSTLLQEMHARQVSVETSSQALREELRAQEVSEVAWREQLRAQESTEIAWREQLQEQIGELRNTVAATESSILTATENSIERAAQSAILAATEAAILKANESRNALPKGTCPTSAALIANGHLHPTIEESPKTTAPSIQTPTIPIAIAPVAEVVLPVAPTMNAFADTKIEPVAEVEPFAYAPNLSNAVVAQVSETVDAVPAPAPIGAVDVQPPTGQFDQYAWNPEPAQAFAPSMEQVPASDPIPFDNAWAVPATPSPATAVDLTNSSANFIEETIEEIPIVEETTSSALPSWWTDDDKTQYKDDSAASAAMASPWNVTSNLDEAKPTEWATESNDSRQDYSEGFATPVEDNFQSPSAWDVESVYESPQIEQALAIGQNDLADLTTPKAVPSFESVNETSLQNDESSELSSLLERFGIAREPDEDPAPEVRKPLKAETKPIEEVPSPISPAFVFPSETDEAITIDKTEVVQAERETVDEPEPVSATPASTPTAESAEEESIEDYMKRLMARMRGGSAEEETKPSAPVAAVPQAPAQSVDTMSSSKIALPTAVASAATERASSSTTGPFDPEEYVPKALAPEKTRNMAAMRELANTSARSAIQVSARRRYGTAIALKLAIALIGLGVGVTLVMINGLNVNIGLIATVASFLVALIWGFDAFSTLKPLLYAAVETREAVAVSAETEEAPQI